MAESAALHSPLSIEQYLELEETATVRHEYVGGRVFAMAGATRRHNRITLNIARRFADAAEGTPCRVSMSDVKVKTPDDVVYYPDVMVACEPEPENHYLEIEPCLIVEVSSPSTETTDRREKMMAYKKIPTLRAYLIVDQERRRVERHVRTEQGEWLQEDLIGEGDVPLFPCLQTHLALRSIYDGV